MRKRLTPTVLAAFEHYLTENEKSRATIRKYLHDLRHFAAFAANRRVDKALVLAYKAALETAYTVRSANSMLAALNAFFNFIGWQKYAVKQFKVQREAYCSAEKELTKAEYAALIRTAERGKNKRLALVLQTICATGIRVSELASITVEAVKRGEVTVNCKGKTRKIFIVPSLQKKLTCYIRTQRIAGGCVFATRSGKPLDRSNIWREMKALCEKAGVVPSKVFPHNLRHLFARTFYHLEKDIAKLADVLGHTNINTTRIYVMSTGAEHRAKMERLQLVT